MPNTPFPDFELPATSGATFKFSEQSGHPVLIYFYPKDNTPGCTAEGQQFRDLYPQFQQFKCAIFGVSRDSLKSHQSFKSKMSFPFELLSDADEQACRLFDVVKMKNMYGRKVRGIERSTFVFDGNGELRREWRGIKVPGHVQEVLDFVKTLK
jgi:peroxiredoxin Q/BCP